MKTAIELLQDDITRIKIEAIVNAANRTLLGGGGVDGAIHRAAGPRLLQACAGLGGCETGQAKITAGFDLTARYVIHTVGPVWHNGSDKERQLLADCYRNSLELARVQNIRSIAFPSISTGAYRFPVEQAAPIALQTVKTYLDRYPEAFDRIVFVLFSDADQRVYERFYPSIFETK